MRRDEHNEGHKETDHCDGSPNYGIRLQTNRHKREGHQAEPADRLAPSPHGSPLVVNGNGVGQQKVQWSLQRKRPIESCWHMTHDVHTKMIITIFLRSCMLWKAFTVSHQILKLLRSYRLAVTPVISILLGSSESSPLSSSGGNSFL